MPFIFSWTSSCPSRNDTGHIILHVNDVSSRIHVGMEVHIALVTVEVRPTFSLSGRRLVLYSYSSRSTDMTGLRCVPWIHSPNTVLGVTKGLPHVPHCVDDLPP